MADEPRTFRPSPPVCRLSAGGHGGDEVAELVVDVFGPGDGVGDLLAEELAVALAEAVQGDAQGGLAQTEARRQRGVRRLRVAAGEAGRKGVEMRGAARGSLLGAEAVGHGLEQGERPGAVEGEVRRGAGIGRAVESLPMGVGVEGGPELRAPFLRPIAVAKVGEVVIEAGEQPGAETSARGFHRGEGFEAEEGGEEALHGILRVGRGQAAAQGVGEEGRAVARAESSEGAPCGGIGIRFPMARRLEHERPAGGGEGGTHKMRSGT